MRIAILGAGAVGACAALELASRGHAVDLYDENTLPITRASRVNEGKIHLGFLYAKDESLRTATTMIRGALHFASSLRRWISFDPAAAGTLSTPFHYAVHRDTMVSVDRLRRHYADCARIFDDMRDEVGRDYLGFETAARADELGRAEAERLVNGEHFVAVFRTTERSIDPRPLATALCEAVLSEPRIRFVGGARVRGVQTSEVGQLEVTVTCDGETYRHPYDQVANTLWHGRLEIDASLGTIHDRPWLYRYKLGNRVFVPLANGSPPSITCVLGPFGDIVNFGGRGLYLSWYPIGMAATSSALRPPEWEQQITIDERHEMFRLSHAHWVDLCPPLAAVEFAPDRVDPAGGVIFSWGDTDIDDPSSELHERYEIGVHSTGGYHTVNTGKFTMAPYFGLTLAGRILGEA